MLLCKDNSNFLFNLIAPIYGLFYKKQKTRFAEVIKGAAKVLDLLAYKTIVDVGCGTGALCSVLYEMGLSVTGADPAEKMLHIAMNKTADTAIRFVQADVLKALPFEDKAFDISIASYVAHGLHGEERKKMYSEMSRITKHKVIIHDYNKNRSVLTTIIEWLERGDYFNFIKTAEQEMRDCVDQMKSCFSSVVVVNVDTRAAWYICTPIHNDPAGE